MLRPYSQLKQEVYLAPKQSVRANLSSIKTFIAAFIVFFCTCLIISFATFYVLELRLQAAPTLSMLTPLTFSVFLSTITGFIVFIKSTILRKITFNFPMIKAFQPKHTC